MNTLYNVSNNKLESPNGRSRRETLEALRERLSDPVTRATVPKDESRRASIHKDGDVTIYSSREASLRSLVEQIDGDLQGLEEPELKLRKAEKRPRSVWAKVVSFLKNCLKLLLLLLLLVLLYCLVLRMFDPCSSCFNPLGVLISWLCRALSRNLRLISYAPPPL